MAHLTVAQAAERYEFLSVRYLRRLISERRIPYVKIGGRVLVDTNDIDAMLAANRHEVAS